MSDERGIISIDGVTKRFGGAVTAVDAVSLEIQEGEFFALLGPSGCGKTTLLRMIAGFEIPTEGHILIDGQDMQGIPPNHRPINMVFQSYAVFPHMTVHDNVAYGLKVGREPAGDIPARVEEALELVKLGRLWAAQARPAFRRSASARRPGPRPGQATQGAAAWTSRLSALDAKLREAMQLELVRLQQSVGITFIIVTHDQQEALSMADRIAVMEEGQVRQVAPPSELYESPNSRFVADFIGRMNLFEAKVAGLENGKLLVEGRECRPRRP